MLAHVEISGSWDRAPHWALRWAWSLPLSLPLLNKYVSQSELRDKFIKCLWQKTQSDENRNKLETASDAFTRLCGLILSELGVWGSLPSSFQDGVRSGLGSPSRRLAGWVWNLVWPMASTDRTCGHPRKRGSFPAGAAKRARWKGGRESHPEGSQRASAEQTAP